MIYDVTSYGVVGDGVTDDAPALQALINTIEALGLGPFNQPMHEIFCPPGLTVALDSGVTISHPMIVRFHSIIAYKQATGFAVRIGSQHCPMNWGDYYFLGILNAGPSPCGAFPSTINGGGAIGLVVNHLTFSKVKVDVIQGFDNCAVFLNGSGGEGYQQVIQHNRFDFGQIANNGCGVRAVSLDAATSSVQANRFDIQNVYQNYINILLDEQGKYATDSNTFNINAMDNNSPIAIGGHGVLNYGRFNHFEIGYMATDIYEAGTAQHNTYRVYNTVATGVAFWPMPSNTSTWWCAP